METIRLLRPTSKTSAKLQCLATCNGDVDKATKLYEFLVKDMTLPDFDAPEATTFEQVKSSALGFVDWVRDNKDDLASLVGYLRSLKGSVSPPVSEPLPPL